MASRLSQPADRGVAHRLADVGEDGVALGPLRRGHRSARADRPAPAGGRCRSGTARTGRTTPIGRRRRSAEPDRRDRRAGRAPSRRPIRARVRPRAAGRDRAPGRRRRDRRTARPHRRAAPPGAPTRVGARRRARSDRRACSRARPRTRPGCTTDPESEKSRRSARVAPSRIGGDVDQRLDVVHDGRCAEQARLERERRLVARFAPVPLDRVEQRRLLPADVRAGTSRNTVTSNPAPSPSSPRGTELVDGGTATASASGYSPRR